MSFLCSYVSKSFDEGYARGLQQPYPNYPPGQGGVGGGGLPGGGNGTSVTTSSASGLGNCHSDGNHFLHAKLNIENSICFPVKLCIHK